MATIMKILFEAICDVDLLILYGDQNYDQRKYYKLKYATRVACLSDI